MKDKVKGSFMVSVSRLPFFIHSHYLGFRFCGCGISGEERMDLRFVSSIWSQWSQINNLSSDLHVLSLWSPI